MRVLYQRTGMGRYWRHKRGFALTLVAAVFAAALVSVLFVEILRTERDHRAMSDEALSDYAAVAAWQFVRLSDSDILNSHYPALSALREFPVNGDLATLPDDIVEANERCPCPATQGPKGAFRLKNEALEQSGGGPEIDANWVREWKQALPSDRRDGNDPRPGVDFAVIDDQLMAIGYLIHNDSDQAVIGYLTSVDTSVELVKQVLSDEELLPPALLDGRPQEELLHLRLHTNDAILFENGDPNPDWHDQEDFHTVSELISGLTVEASVRPEAAPLLLVGGMPRSRLPILAGLLTLALLLGGLAAYQLSRERRLMRMRSDTIARISHELRTPLSQIRLFTDTLQLGRSRAESERSYALNVIDRETRRLDHLVDNVLRFGAKGRCDESLHPQDLPLQDFLPQVVREFEPIALHKDVRLETAFQGDPIAHVDKESLRRVLFNLLDNACKYGPENGHVRISAEEVDDDRTRIMVDDQGPGLSLEDRERVWSMYHRQDRRGIPGSGIGLALVQHYVHRQDGRVWIEEAPGNGTRVVIELPGGRG